jgi:hypothetical protein
MFVYEWPPDHHHLVIAWHAPAFVENYWCAIMRADLANRK